MENTEKKLAEEFFESLKKGYSLEIEFNYQKYKNLHEKAKQEHFEFLYDSKVIKQYNLWKNREKSKKIYAKQIW